MATASDTECFPKQSIQHLFTLMTSLAGCGYHPVEAHAPERKQSVIIRSAVEEHLNPG